MLFLAGTSGRAFAATTAAIMLGCLASSLVGASELRRALGRVRLSLGTARPAHRRRCVATPFMLHVHNRGAVALRSVELRVHGSGDPRPEPTLTIDLPAGAATDAELRLTIDRAGHWRVHGIALVAPGPLGLAEVSHYVPCELPLAVYPAPARRLDVERVLTPVGSVREREGRLLNRRVSSGLELREIRDYVPGDPLKSVAWKATARQQKPLVRAFEEETLRRVQIIVDIGPSMRAGSAGEAPLDEALDVTATLAEHFRRDRVGLTTFDHRVHGHLRPGRGIAHARRLAHLLMDTTNVVDEDLTAISDAELLVRVGAFLERQEGLLARRHATDLTSPQVARTLIDPLREVFDEAIVFSTVTRHLSDDRDRGRATLFAKTRPAADLTSARLRLFCALRGMPLPYRLTGPPNARDRGLTEAITRNLASGGADTLVLVSDLRGFTADGEGIRAMRLAHAHKRNTIALQVGHGRIESALGAALRAARITVLRERRVSP